MKKRIIICTIGIIMLCLCYILLSTCDPIFDIRACIPGIWNPFNGERPTDYVPSKWVSKDPYIWFEVLPSEDDATLPQKPLRGQIVLGDTIIEITAGFISGRSMYIDKANTSNGCIFEGICKFGPEKLIVRITKKTDLFFSSLDGEFAPENDIIIFERTDIE